MWSAFARHAVVAASNIIIINVGFCIVYIQYIICCIQLLYIHGYRYIMLCKYPCLIKLLAYTLARNRRIPFSYPFPLYAKDVIYEMCEYMYVCVYPLLYTIESVHTKICTLHTPIYDGWIVIVVGIFCLLINIIGYATTTTVWSKSISETCLIISRYIQYILIHIHHIYVIIAHIYLHIRYIEIIATSCFTCFIIKYHLIN